jgi:hypothetical protein
MTNAMIKPLATNSKTIDMTSPVWLSMFEIFFLNHPKAFHHHLITNAENA